MRFKAFSTVKPRRFSFHTRYYDENKISNGDKVTVQKGSFSKFRNRYDTEVFASRAEEAKRRRRTLLFSILIMLGITYMVLRFSDSIENLLSLFLQSN